MEEYVDYVNFNINEVVNDIKNEIDLEYLIELINNNEISDLRDYLKKNMKPDKVKFVYDNLITRMEQKLNNTKYFFSAFNELCSIENLNKLYPLDKEFSELCTKHEVDLFNDFFIKNKYKVSYDNCFLEAIKANNLLLALYIYDISDKDNYITLCSISRDTKYKCLNEAIKNNNLDIFKLIVSMGITIIPELFYEVCELGYLDFVQFIASTKKFNVHSEDNKAYYEAIVNNKNNIVDWFDSKYTIEFNLSNQKLFKNICFVKHYKYVCKVFNQ